MLTKDQVKDALPANLKNAATQEFTDKINNITTDPIIAEQIRDNFISYSTILKEGKFKSDDYLSAVAYVSYKLMGLSNLDAYSKTFPNRYAQLVGKGTSQKDISAYVAAYHKGKLVNLIMEQSLVPVWIVNQEAYQKAINTQVDIMTNSASDVARTQAANSILTHLAKPKDMVPTVNINVGENQSMIELKQHLTKLAETQRELIDGGYTAKQIAATPLIDKKAEKVDVS